MSPKIRALVWEELRMGAVPVAWSMGAGLIGFAGLHLFLDGRPPSDFSLAVYLIPVFVLVYTIPHGGLVVSRHSTGLPPRILLLPIEVEQALLSILLVRLAIASAANALLLLSLWLLFPGALPWILLLILPSIYLVRQAWNWIYPSRLTLSVYSTVLLAAVLALSLLLGRLPYEMLSSPRVTWTIAALFFAGTGLWTYTVSVFAVRRFRCNASPVLPIRLPWRIASSGEYTSHSVQFLSAKTANLWAFSRQQGSTLPVAAIGTAFLGVLFYVIFGMTFVIDPSTAERFPVVAALQPARFLFLGPWCILLLAATLTGILRAGAGMDTDRVCESTERYMPLSTSAMVLTRICGVGLSLGATWVLVAIATSGYGLFAHDAFLWRVYRDAWRAGEVSATEIARAELGLPLLMLLLAWVLISIRTRLTRHIGALALLPVAFEAIRQMQLRPIGYTGLQDYLRYQIDLEDSLRFAVAFVTIAPIASLLWVAHRRVAPLPHVAFCAATWLFVTLVVYPYQSWPLGSPDVVAIALAMAAGSLAILPYPALLIDLHRSRHGSDGVLSPLELRRRSLWRLCPRDRVLLSLFLAAVLILAAYLSWSSRPAYIDTFRARGTPATPGDIAGAVAAATGGTGHAGGCPALLKTIHVSDASFRERWLGRFRSEPGQFVLVASGDLLVPGADSLRRGAIAGVLRQALEAWDEQIARPAVASILDGSGEGQFRGPFSHAIDHVAVEQFYLHKGTGAIPNDLIQPQFPLSIMEESWGVANRSGDLQRLANALAMAIWVASIEGRKTDFFRALDSAEIMAGALAEEPTVSSQMAYLYVYNSSVRAVQFSMNRLKFTNGELKSLPEWSERVLSPGAARRAVELSIAHEVASDLDAGSRALRTGRPLTGMAAYYESWIGGFHRAVKLRLNAAIGSTPGTSVWREFRDFLGPRFEELGFAVYRAGQYDEALKRTELNARLLETACALERFRLSRGTLPGQLEQLIPEFLTKVDGDPYRRDGEISYRIRDDGEFVIYGWGPDGEDGWEDEDDSDDHTFSVAPPSARGGLYSIFRP